MLNSGDFVLPETAPPVSPSDRPVCPDSYSSTRDRETWWRPWWNLTRSTWFSPHHGCRNTEGGQRVLYRRKTSFSWAVYGKVLNSLESFTSSVLRRNKVSGCCDSVQILLKSNQMILFDFNWTLKKSSVYFLECYLSRALDRAFCRLVEAAGKGNLTAMLRQ